MTAPDDLLAESERWLTAHFGPSDSPNRDHDIVDLANLIRRHVCVAVADRNQAESAQADRATPGRLALLQADLRAMRNVLGAGESAGNVACAVRAATPEGREAWGGELAALRKLADAARQQLALYDERYKGLPDVQEIASFRAVLAAVDASVGVRHG